MRRGAVGTVTEAGEGRTSGDGFAEGVLSPRWKDALLYNSVLQTITPWRSGPPKGVIAVIGYVTKMLGLRVRGLAVYPDSRTWGSNAHHTRSTPVLPKMSGY